MEGMEFIEYDADMQRLLQENSALRTELNKALIRLAANDAIPDNVKSYKVSLEENKLLRQRIDELNRELSFYKDPIRYSFNKFGMS